MFWCRVGLRLQNLPPKHFPAPGNGRKRPSHAALRRVGFSVRLFLSATRHRFPVPPHPLGIQLGDSPAPSSHTKCFEGRFARVDSHTNPSTCSLCPPRQKLRVGCLKANVEQMVSEVTAGEIWGVVQSVFEESWTLNPDPTPQTLNPDLTP